MTADRGRVAVRGSGGRLLIGVRARPGASATRVVGVYGDRLKVEIAAPADAGRANRELLQAFAGWLGVPIGDVDIYVGHTSRDKVLTVSGVDEAALRGRLDALTGADCEDE